MKFREEVLQSFKEKLLLVAPDTVAVYSFTRKISQFDKWLKDNKKFIRPSTLFNASKFPEYLEEALSYERTNNK